MVRQQVRYMNIFQLGLNKEYTMPNQLKKSFVYGIYLRVLYKVPVNFTPTS